MTNKLLNRGESEAILIYIATQFQTYFISATASQITTTIIAEPSDPTTNQFQFMQLDQISPMGQLARFNLLADPVRGQCCYSKPKCVICR